MDTVIDPVCGRVIERGQAVAQIITDEREYYFHSQDCFDLFQQSPEDYIDTESVDPTDPDQTEDDRNVDATSEFQEGEAAEPGPSKG